MSYAGREIETPERLDEILTDLNEHGLNPVVVGFDANNSPFLAYGWAPGGDGWDCGFVVDDTHSAEFDYSDGTKRCEDCGAFERRNISKLSYPLCIIMASQ